MFNDGYAKAVQAHISALSARYSAVNFHPHITLLGTILLDESKILDLLRECIREVRPLTVSFEGVLHTKEYFRCVFLKAAETDDLLALSKKTRQIFSWSETASAYYPHASLIYAGLDSAERQKVANAVPRELIQATPQIVSVELWKTTGTVEQWKKIETLKLTHS